MPEQQTKPRPRPLEVTIDILDEWRDGAEFLVYIGGQRSTPVNVHRMACATIWDPADGADWTLFVGFDIDDSVLSVEEYYYRAGRYRLLECGPGIPVRVDSAIVDELRAEFDRYNGRNVDP
jgi:hypothetical protein